MLLAITGILLNTYVIVRLVQLAVHDYVSILKISQFIVCRF